MIPHYRSCSRRKWHAGNRRDPDHAPSHNCSVFQESGRPARLPLPSKRSVACSHRGVVSLSEYDGLLRQSLSSQPPAAPARPSRGGSQGRVLRGSYRGRRRKESNAEAGPDFAPDPCACGQQVDSESKKRSRDSCHSNLRARCEHRLKHATSDLFLDPRVHGLPRRHEILIFRPSLDQGIDLRLQSPAVDAVQRKRFDPGHQAFQQGDVAQKRAFVLVLANELCRRYFERSPRPNRP